MDIAETDIRELVNSGSEEHLQLEYKSALYEASGRERTCGKIAGC
jgi:hypothetical protein